MCSTVSNAINQLIDKVIDELHQKEIKKANYTQFQSEFMLPHKEKAHKEQIRKLCAHIMELIFKSHIEHFSIKQVSKLVYTQTFQKSIFICATEIQFFDQNIKEFSSMQLMELVGQTPFDHWRILNIFIKLYYDMPNNMASYFRDVESQIVTELAWKRGSMVFNLLRRLMEQQDSQEEEKRQDKFNEKVKAYNQFFKRVTEQAAFLVGELGKLLKLPKGLQDLIWVSVQAMLSCETFLLQGRHLD